MHPALQTDDVLDEIFAHLRTSYVGHKRDIVTLCRAAQVCKHFLPHALDALWSSLDSLNPLLRLLPRNCTSWGEANTMLLTDLLEPEDLFTFDSHSCKVKSFHQEYPSPPIRTPVVLELLGCLNRQFLLPNLRYLEVSMGGEASDAYSFFLSPSLEEIKITFDSDEDEDILFFFPRLVRAAPSLRSLTISDDVPIPDNMLHLTRHLKELRTLDTSNDFEIMVDSFLSMFPFAAYLTTLRADSIIIVEIDNPAFRLKRSGGPGPSIQFPSLKTLELRDMHHNIVDVSDVLSSTLFPNLQDLVLHGGQYKANSESDNGGSPCHTYSLYRKAWCQFFSVAFSEDSCLQSLKIPGASAYTSRQSEDIGIKLSRLLEHATQNQPLSSLSLEVPLLQSLTETSVQSLAKTFPKLTYLSLVPYINTSSAIITFQDLALLAQLLPQLSTLHICIDGTGACEPPKVPLLIHRLETLGLGRLSKIGSPFLFGRHVARIFPFASLDTSAGLLPKGDILVSAFNMIKGCRDDEYERRVRND